MGQAVAKRNEIIVVVFVVITTTKGKVHDLDCLENSNSGDEIWDAMQDYLVQTGELHNNVRMTWGKMLVHWDHSSNSSTCIENENPVSNLLHVLCYLNDRYALDGLSPPSYAGLLWCIGWSDKPDRKGGISTKRRYKLSASGFQQAREKLMNGGLGHVNNQTTIMASLGGSTARKRNVTVSNIELYDNDTSSQSAIKKKRKSSEGKTLRDFFIQK